MSKKKKPVQPAEIRSPNKPKIFPNIEPEEPLMPDHEPKLIPEEDPYEDVPHEMPEPDKGL